MGWSEVEDGDEWDEFVTINRGSIFHLWSWRKVLEDTYSKPLYLAYRDSDGEILAVCPFFYRTGRLLWYLDSLPESHSAGPIISNHVTDISRLLTALRKSVRFSPFKPAVAMRIRTEKHEIIEPMTNLGFGYTVTQLFI